MKQRRDAVIIFPDEWASYSPTLLNLVEALRPSYRVLVIAFDDGQYQNHLLPKNEYHWIKMRPAVAGILRKFRALKLFKALRLLAELRTLQAEVVIGVDSVGLWCALVRYGTAHFLSLEVNRDWWFRFCSPDKIRSVFIQTIERYEYIFDSLTLPTFLIQNAPSIPVAVPTAPSVDDHLVYFGNIIPSHGIYECLEAMSLLDGMKLTVKGIMSVNMAESIKCRYEGLISSGRLVLDTSYLKQEEVLGYLSRFSAGFCFYNFDLIKKDDFNYLSAPSGKLFNYYAAKVPVIGSDILGLRTVREYGAGVLLNEITSENIAAAVHEVLTNRESMRQACWRAAEEFDFGRKVQSYLDFLASN